MARRKQVAEVQAAVREEVTQGPVEVQAPKPAKLSKSLIEKPVAVVRAHVNARLDAAEQAGEPAPARKELVNELLAMGIAHYTVRTQVQVALSKRRASKIEAVLGA